MKTTLNRLCQLALTALLGLASACQSDSEEPAPVTPTPLTQNDICLPKTLNASSSNGNTISYVYEYTADRQLASFQIESSPNTKRSGMLTYDNQGYRTKYVDTDMTGRYETNYTYTNSRLTKQVRVRTSTSGTSLQTTITTYEYDSNGNLSRQQTDGGSTYLLTNGKLTSITGSGILFTIENGRITRFVNNANNSYNSYEYDTQGWLVKQESGVAGVRQGYVVFERDPNVKVTVPSLDNLLNEVTRPKGWPVPLNLYGSGVTIKRSVGYQLINGKEQRVSESTGTFVLNTKGMPLEINSRQVSIDYNTGSPVEKVTTSKSVVTYGNCN